MGKMTITDEQIMDALLAGQGTLEIRRSLGVGWERLKRIRDGMPEMPWRGRCRKPRRRPRAPQDETRQTTRAERQAAVRTGSAAEWAAIMEEWLARHGERPVTCGAVHQVGIDLGMGWLGEHPALCLAKAEGRVHAGHRIMGPRAGLPGWRLVPIKGEYRGKFSRA